MTELLFQSDSYIKEFKAEVKEINEEGVVFDRTAFVFKGGGLQSDTGIMETTLGEKFIVKEVISKGGKILHKLSPEPTEQLISETVKCIIDWEQRYRQMRMHTALHSISGLLFRKYGAVVTGGNITAKRSRADFEIDHLHKERVQEITKEIEKIIEDNHQVSISFMERNEALKDPDLIRTKVNLIPESVKVLRIVEIENVDRQADGGVHVRSTKEIGTFVPLKSENRGKNNKRLYFTLEP